MKMYRIYDESNGDEFVCDKNEWLASLEYNLDTAVQYEDLTTLEALNIVRKAMEHIYCDEKSLIGTTESQWCENANGFSYIIDIYE